MSYTIALAGNPNSGKTTMFNNLTGSAQYVGNWPGVTVEKKEGKLKGNKDVIIQDLPGIYSLSPYTLEEVVTRKYLIHERPDAMINIIDATNIERNLYLTTQLLEIGIPVVIALNMIDVVRKNGDIINCKKLGELLGCEVMETSAIKGLGAKEIAQKAVGIAAQKPAVTIHKFSPLVEEAIADISMLVEHKVAATHLRWFSIKLFERDTAIIEELKLSKQTVEQIEQVISTCEKKLDDDSESIITIERYDYISNVVNQCVKIKNNARLSVSDKIDQIVTHRILALPIFVLVMFLIYYVSISTVGDWMTGWVNDELFGAIIPDAVGGWLESAGTAAWLSGLIMDGIIAGVGAVLGFLPQMLVLFLCLALLEDCGYMARIAFIMDRIFRKFGLSGKSFIPMLIGTGCGVPGIMASRTIENQNDRRMTVITTTFIPCGAKLPIIALIAGAFFQGSAWVSTSAYFIGVAAIVVSGIILKKTRGFAGEVSPFVMELPSYHLPGAKGVLRTTFQRGWAFIKKATSIVLLATVGVWFLSRFNLSMKMVEINDSMLAAIGNAIAPLFAPLGWGDWRAAVAAFTGLIAKENVVGTFGVLFGFAEVAEDGIEYWPALLSALSALGAYSFLVFNLLCAPCFAAIGAIRREMMSAKWTLFAIAYQTGFAYVMSLIVFQLGTLFTGGGFGLGTIVALGMLALIVYLLMRKPSAPNQGISVGDLQKAVR